MASVLLGVMTRDIRLFLASPHILRGDRQAARRAQCTFL